MLQKKKKRPKKTHVTGEHLSFQQRKNVIEIL